MTFILLLAFLSFFILWIGATKGYFTPLSENRFKEPSPSPLSFTAVLVFFGIYLSITLLVAPLMMHAVHNMYAKHTPGKPPPLGTVSGIQLAVLLCIVLFFILYARAYNAALFKRIWKNTSLKLAQPVHTDLLLGFLSWFIAFPLVALIGEISDLMLNMLFNMQNYEQVAVRYLKTNLYSVGSMVIPLFIILIAAPMIEEFLFRGILQTFFKKFFQVRLAIVLSALCFALFHFAPSQGLGNVSLVLSLFTFALFLGYVYERQASLLASITLHISFNLFSTIRILFFPE